jgi:hypothetical protein
MRTSNLNNYVNLLNDVYAYGSMTTALCRKHKLTNQTTKSLKDLKYVDQRGTSLMNKRPTPHDAQKVIVKNRELAKRHKGKNFQTEIKFVKTKAPIQVQKRNTTEINLFWGMIKIKR